MYSDEDDDEDEGNKKDISGKQAQLSGKTQKILEKGRVNLQRSKSELGEQHKRMISHLSRSRNELRAQNKRVIASLSSGVERSRRRLNRAIKSNGGGSFKRNDFPEMTASYRETSTTFRETNGFHDDADDRDGGATLRVNNGDFKENRLSNGDLRLDLSPVPSHRSTVMMSASMTTQPTTIPGNDLKYPGNERNFSGGTAHPPPARDLDSMLMDLGIDPISNGISNDIIISTSSPRNNFRESPNLGNGAKFESYLPREPTALEIRLEEGYGEEFEFMDGVTTIKRSSAADDFDGTLKRTEDEDDDEEEKYNKSDSGFADEVFSELSKSSTFKRGNQQQQQHQQPQPHYRNHMEKPQQRWSFKRRDSLSYLPSTDIVDDSGTSSPKLLLSGSGDRNFPGRDRNFPGNGMSSVEMSSERRRQKRIRRLSAQSYTNGTAANVGGIINGSGGANNLSYESIVNANYDDEEEEEDVNNRSTLGSNHRLEKP